jgi:hypothetical protein
MKLPNNVMPLAWGLAGGALGCWIVLAFVFGWTSAGTAQRQAAQQTEQAVVTALAPVCADRFLALPDVAEKKATLAKAMSWERRDLFPEEWVTLPGDDSPDHMLVSACSKIVLETPLPNAANPEKENAASPPASKG